VDRLSRATDLRAIQTLRANLEKRGVELISVDTAYHDMQEELLRALLGMDVDVIRPRAARR
jgi:DNA invertase Pin-like site-specific DNA recombinase